MISCVSSLDTLHFSIKGCHLSAWLFLNLFGWKYVCVYVCGWGWRGWGVGWWGWVAIARQAGVLLRQACLSVVLMYASTSAQTPPGKPVYFRSLRILSSTAASSLHPNTIISFTEVIKMVSPFHKWRLWGLWILRLSLVSFKLNKYLVWEFRIYMWWCSVYSCFSFFDSVLNSNPLTHGTF